MSANDNAGAVSALPGAMTAEALRAFREFDSALCRAIDNAKGAGVPQGLIVALLFGQAHQQTSEMMERA